MTIERRWDNRRQRLLSFGIEPNSRLENGTAKRRKTKLVKKECPICSKRVVYYETLERHLNVDHEVTEENKNDILRGSKCIY